MILQCQEGLFDLIANELMLHDYYPTIVEETNQGGYIQCGEKGWYFIQDNDLLVMEIMSKYIAADSYVYLSVTNHHRITCVGIPNESHYIFCRQGQYAHEIRVGYKSYITFKKEVKT